MKNGFRNSLTLIILLIFAFIITAMNEAEAEGPLTIGRISSITGPAVYLLQEGGSKSQEGKLFSPLREGYTVVIPDKSSLRIIFFSDNHEEHLKGPMKVRLTAQGSTPLAGSKGSPEITRKATRYNLPSNRSYGGIAAGIIRDRKPAVYHTITGATRNPGFVWKPVYDVQYYEITISEVNTASGDSGIKELFRAMTKGTAFSVPAGKELSYGAYYQIGLNCYDRNPEGRAGSEARIVESNSRAITFVLPSDDDITSLGTAQKHLDSLKAVNNEWISTSTWLFYSYLRFGFIREAAKTATLMCSRLEKDPRLGEMSKDLNNIIEMNRAYDSAY